MATGKRVGPGLEPRRRDRKRRFAGVRGTTARALRETAARFRSLTELSSDWYWEQDEQLRLTFMSSYVGERTGLDPSQYLGRQRWDLPALNLSEADWQRHRAQLERHEPFRNFEVERPVAHGRSVWLSLSGEPIFDRGRFKGYRGIGRDITEQKRAERILRLEHQVTRAFSEANKVAAALQAAIRAICESEKWECGRYLQVAGALLRFGAAWSVANADIERYIEQSRSMSYGPGIGIVGKVWQSREPLWVPDVTTHPGVARPGLARETGMHSAFAVPVVTEGRVIGVFIFQSREIRKPDERLLQAIQLIGGQVGQLVKRASAEEAMRESEARFRSLTQMSSDFFWETDERHRYTQLVHGPSYAGKAADNLIGKTAWELPSIAPDESGWAPLRGAMEAHRPFRDFEFGRPWHDGGVRYFSVNGEPYFAADGSFGGYRGVGRDITEIVVARERIASLAYTDPLTGLANRTSLGPTLEQAVERAHRRGSKLAGLFVDLDGFKQINDLHGHPAGDALLIEVARRLRGSVRASDPVARLGGDEFFVVLEDVQSRTAVEAVVNKILAAILHPCALGGDREARLSASIGVSLHPDDADDAATLVKHADMAMYAAKQAGRNAHRFFQAELAPDETVQHETSSQVS